MHHGTIQRSSNGLRFALVAWVAGLAMASGSAHADDTADLAKKLSNPIADLISIPFQFNYNDGIGPAGDGKQGYLNVQPVIPFTLNKDWNLISRTIVPIVDQNDIFPQAGSQFGLGNTTQSFFLSPSQPVNGFVWGVGPVLYLPTATDSLIGPDKWGVGPTAVGLWQGSGWTVGMLANQIWSVAGNSSQANINSTYLQPFIAYSTKDAWTFSVNAESTYNWTTSEWSVPLHAQIAKIVRFGKLPVQLFAAATYWAKSPQDAGPTGWGARAGFTVLLPK
jgi:hypothetical protein